MFTHRIAVIPGDGIGPEVMPEGLRVLEAAGKKFGIAFHFDHFNDWCTPHYLKHGTMMPDNWQAQIGSHDAIFFGAVGTPDIVPDHEAVWGSIIKIRREFDQFVNLRPVRLMRGVPAPLAHRLPGDIDFLVVRENTEGAYIGEGQSLSEDGETALLTQKITRKGSERIVRYAFDMARAIGRKKVTIVHKANILKSTSGLFLKVAREVAAQYPDIECNEMIVDNTCMQLVMRPEQFDVIVTTNLFGDIISDLCAGLVGGLGLAPGANIGKDCAIFEAVHGSAPDIAGKGIANPCALLLGAVQMLEHIGQVDAAKRLKQAIVDTMNDKDSLTPDLGGTGSTQTFAQAIIKHIKA